MNRKKNPYIPYQFSELDENVSGIASETQLDGLDTKMGTHNPFQHTPAFNKDTFNPDTFNGDPFADEPDLYPDPLDTSLLAQEKGNNQEKDQEISVFQSEITKLEDERLRMLAEMDNFKKRLTREKDEQVRFASEAVLADLLPSLDNFELALSYGKNNDACREMLQGLQMTHKLLLDALAVHGLEQVGEVGEPFNPEIHEAMTQEKRDDIPSGHVSQLFQSGYQLRGRLLRPAKVVVSS